MIFINVFVIARSPPEADKLRDVAISGYEGISSLKAKV